MALGYPLVSSGNWFSLALLAKFPADVQHVSLVQCLLSYNYNLRLTAVLRAELKC